MSVLSFVFLVFATPLLRVCTLEARYRQQSAIPFPFPKTPMNRNLWNTACVNETASEYDVVVQHLESAGISDPQPKFADYETLRSKYLFPHDRTTQPSEYSIVVEHQRGKLSSNRDIAEAVTKVLG